MLGVGSPAPAQEGLAEARALAQESLKYWSARRAQERYRHLAANAPAMTVDGSKRHAWPDTPSSILTPARQTHLHSLLPVQRTPWRLTPTTLIADEHRFSKTDVRPIQIIHAYGDMVTGELVKDGLYSRKMCIAMNVRNGYLPSARAPQITPGNQRRDRQIKRHKSSGELPPNDLRRHIAELHSLDTTTVTRSVVDRLRRALERFKQSRERLVETHMHALSAQAAREEDNLSDAQVTARHKHICVKAEAALARAQKASTPLVCLLPPYCRGLITDAERTAAKGDRSGVFGAYTNVAVNGHDGWCGKSLQKQWAVIQSSNMLRVTRRFLLSGGCSAIDGLAELITLTEAEFVEEELMQLEIVLHDAQGVLLTTFRWHRDDNSPESGHAENGIMCRTVIVCLDAGCVNVEIAGFETVMYHELPGFPYCMLSMCPSVWHTSRPVHLPDLANVVQRKIVMHMRHRQGRPRVDWMLYQGDGV